MATRWARFARGWVVAVFSTFVAALSHTVVDGAPGVLPVVLSLAFAGMVCVGLAGRALSFWRGTASVLASQLIFHGLFSLGGAGGGLGTDAVAAETAHVHEVLPGLAQAAAAAGQGAMPGARAGVAHDGFAMWLAHLVAAMVTIAALRYGERAFWGLFEIARLSIRALFPPRAIPVAPHAPRSTPTTARVFTPRDLGALLSSRHHRGPPPVLRLA
jgi:hypothetical protein